MGVSLTDLPEHVRKQVKTKLENSTVAKAKAVPHDSRMNKTESNYAGYLQKLKMAGDIRDWRHEPFNIRLADRTFYKPDFAVVTEEGTIEIHEVKGRWMDDALVKIKVAAEHMPWFRFIAIRHDRGSWKKREFKTKK